MRPSPRHCIVPSALLLVTAFAAWGHAACNTDTMPEPFQPHESAVGSIDSPFLFVGEERVLISPSITVEDTITIAFLPPQGSDAKPELVVLADDCGGVDTSACGGTPTRCVPTKPSARVRGGVPAVAFTVPDVKTDGVTRVGPVQIAATASGVACELADPAKGCNALAASAHACIGSLTHASNPPLGSKVNSATVMPKFNDFSKICDPDGSSGKKSCKGNGQKLEFALDLFGNLLIPMDWKNVVRKAGSVDEDCDPKAAACDTREVSAATSLPAFQGSNDPIRIPASDPDALVSLNSWGLSFSNPPEFKVVDPPAAGEFGLTGDTDKHYSILRIWRCPGGATVCANPYFDLAHLTMFGAPGRIPKKGKKGGQCDAFPPTDCDPANPCPGGKVCRWVGGTAGAFGGPRPVAVPAPPPPAPPVAAPPPPAPAANLAAQRWKMALWLFALVAIGFAWMYARSKKI